VAIMKFKTDDDLNNENKKWMEFDRTFEIHRDIESLIVFGEYKNENTINDADQNAKHMENNDNDLVNLKYKDDCKETHTVKQIC